MEEPNIDCPLRQMSQLFLFEFTKSWLITNPCMIATEAMTLLLLGIIISQEMSMALLIVQVAFLSYLT